MLSLIFSIHINYLGADVVFILKALFSCFIFFKEKWLLVVSVMTNVFLFCLSYQVINLFYYFVYEI